MFYFLIVPLVKGTPTVAENGTLEPVNFLILYLLFPILAGVAVILNDLLSHYLCRHSGGKINISETAINIFTALIFYLIVTTQEITEDAMSWIIIVVLIVLSTIAFYGVIYTFSYCIIKRNKWEKVIDDKC